MVYVSLIKNAIIEEFGQEYYDQLVAKQKADEAVLLDEKNRKKTIETLVAQIKHAVSASSPHGMADSRGNDHFENQCQKGLVYY